MADLDTIRGFHDELTAIRRDIHAHPETRLRGAPHLRHVASELEEWGIEVHRGIGDTGVVGVLREGNGEERDRAARRHGRAADPGGDRAAHASQNAGPDACLRP